jgi:hypothetical protein
MPILRAVPQDRLSPLANQNVPSLWKLFHVRALKKPIRNRWHFSIRGDYPAHQASWRLSGLPEDDS